MKSTRRQMSARAATLSHPNRSIFQPRRPRLFESLESRILLSRLAYAPGVGLLADSASASPYLLPEIYVRNLNGYLTGPNSDPALSIARNYLSSHAADLGLTPQDLLNAIVTDQYSDANTGETHIYLAQQFNGLEIGNTSLTLTVMSNGQLLNVAGSFVPNVTQYSSATPTPSLSAAQAARAATVFGLSDSTPSYVAGDGSQPQRTVLSDSAISLDPITAQLKYLATPSGLELVWNMPLRTPDNAHWYDFNVDAQTGLAAESFDWVENASYDVIPLPTEAPNDGSRSLVTNPADPAASPYGWHDTNGAPGAEYFDTRGNNVIAQEDVDGNNSGGFRPSGGASLTFDFPLDLNQSPSAYQSAAITNLFYWNNIVHDIYYHYGFTEAAGNFQITNYTGKGLGNDAVVADAQDGSGINNANFASPPDGQSPRMQMFLFNSTSPYRDGDLDALVMVHEYTHGLSNRLTGGPANANALSATQSGGMGEGWSDFYALMLTQKPSDTQNAAYPVGTYVLGQSTSGPGVRRYPYSYNMTIDPETINYYNTDSSHEVHNTGEIWCTTLWDLNWLLINKYGYDPNLYTGYTGAGSAGNKLCLQLITDAMKIQPANPSFKDARDAILQADQALTGGANKFQIWTAFARRGMGYSFVDSSSSANSVIVAYDLPASLICPSVVSQSPTGSSLTPISTLDLTFSEAMNPTSFAIAADINSFTGPGGTNLKSQITSFSWLNSNTTLHLVFNAQAFNGLYSLSIGPNILGASDGNAMDQNANGTPGEAGDAYTATFRYDALLGQVVYTLPADGSLVSLPLASMDFTFNEPFDPASISASDLTLSQGTATGVSFLNSNTTARFSLSGLNTEGTLTLNIAAGAINDAVGNPMAAYAGSLAIDVGTAAFPALTALATPGTLIYTGTASGTIGNCSDTDSYTLALDSGQLLSLVVLPASTLCPVLEVRDPANKLIASVAATAVGTDAFLQAIPILVSGTYTVTISNASLGYYGAYSIKATLNAALQASNYNGPPNSTLATAQDLGSNMVTLSGDSGIASVLSSTSAFYLADFESGTNGFTIANGTTGLWHLSTGRGSQTGHSSSHAFYYGQGEGANGGGNYNSGSNAGTITSPSIALPTGVAQLPLTFNYVLQTQNSRYYDASALQISNNGGLSWNTLAMYNGIAESTTWRTSDPINLASYAGQTVQLRWSFNTIDGYSNNYEGWYVDDVQIQASQIPAAYYSLNLAAGESITAAVKRLSGSATLTLRLFDATGTQLVAAASSATNFDRMISDFVAPTAGTYYVCVDTSSAGDYALTVLKNADFDTEANDTVTLGQPLLASNPDGHLYVLGSIESVPTINQTIDFSEVSPRNLNGATIKGATFKFQVNGSDSTDATIGEVYATGPLTYVNPPLAEGTASGILTITLPAACSNFGFGLSGYSTGSIANAVVAQLYNSSTLVATVPLNTSVHSPYYYSEGLFSYSGAPITKAVLDFNEAAESRFVLDNVTFTSATTSPGFDVYAVSLAAGVAASFSTSTPADGSGEFANTLNPRLRLLSSSGTQLAIDDNSAPDGRNALLTYTPSTTGTYYLEVTSSTTVNSTGEYLLNMTGASTPAAPLTVTSFSPANGALLKSCSTATFTFSNPLLLTTLQAADLCVDGIPCTAVSLNGDRIAVFTLPTGLANGPHTLNINAGIITDIRGTSLAAFSSSFTLDTIPPRIIASNILENDTLSPGSLSCQLTFSEAMLTTYLDTSDFTLKGNLKNVTYTPASYSYDASKAILTLVYNSLPEDNYTLTLLSSTYAFTDSVGNLLDGERNASTTVPTGDGAAGGNFVLDLSLDAFTTTSFPVPLAQVSPAAGFTYSSSVAGAITSASDTDSFTLSLDAGQTLTLVGHPGTNMPGPAISLVGPNGATLGSTAAALSNQDSLLQAVPITASGLYTITASLPSGATGAYTLQAYLNAAVSAEDHGGASDDTIASAQNIDSSFITLGTGSRGALLGHIEAAGSLPSEIESNDTLATANSAVNNFLAYNGNIYQLGLKGAISTNGDNDWYQIGTLDAGDTITICLSGSASSRGTLAGTSLGLYRANGGSPTLVTSNSSNTHGYDSLIYRYTITTADTYYVLAQGYASSSTGTYDLGIELENLASAPQCDQNVTSEAEPNDSAATATDASRSWRNATYLSQTTASLTYSDTDYFQYQFTAGDLVTVDIKGVSNVLPMVSLLNAAGTPIASEDGNSIATGEAPLYAFIIPTTGLYYLHVFLYSVPGNYSAKVYLSTNTAPPAPTLPCDYYSFSAQAGDHFSFAISPLVPGTSPDLTLRNADNNILATATSGCQNVGEAISDFTIPSTGTYYLAVTGCAVSTDYSLVATRNIALELEPNDSASQAQPLKSGGSVLGYLEMGPVTVDPDSYADGTDLTHIVPGMTFSVVNYPSMKIYPQTNATFHSTGTKIFAHGNSGSLSDACWYSNSMRIDFTLPVYRVSIDILPYHTGISNAGVLSAYNAAGTQLAQVLTPGNTPYDTATVTRPTPDIAYVIITGYKDLVFLDNLVINGGLGNDWYSVPAKAGDVISLQTATPGDGPNEFTNTLDPKLDLYDATGKLLASDDNSAPDRRNAALTFTAPAAGTYYIRISSVTASCGEYTLLANLDSAPIAAACAPGVIPGTPRLIKVLANDSDPDNDALSLTALSSPLHGTVAIQPDQSVLYTPAPGYTGRDYFNYTISDGRGGFATATVALTITPPIPGDATLDGKVTGADYTIWADHYGMTGQTWMTGDFTGDGKVTGADYTIWADHYNQVLPPLAPRIIASNILENDALPPGSLSISLAFSDIMLLANLDTSDFTLHGLLKNVDYTPSSYSYDASKTILTLTYPSLPEDNYTLTLLSSASAFAASDGTLLDGERNPAGTIPTGNGAAGGNFVLDFSLDIPTTAFPAFSPIGAPGTLVYTSSTSGTLTTCTDTDSFTLNLDAGQLLTLAGLPSASLCPTLELRDPSNNLIASYTSSAAGAPALLQSIPILTSGTYTLTVSSAAASIGDYSLQACLNAALESENFNGPANDTRATAQNLDLAFLNLIPGSSATVASAVGKITAAATDWYSFTLNAGQSATLAAKRLPGSTANLTLNLFDASGNQLAKYYSSSNFSCLISDFLASVGGTYYVCLSADKAADYVLTAAVNSTLDTETNDTYAAPQSLFSAPSAGQYAVLGSIASGDAADIFAVTLTTGTPISLRTFTPADGAGQFNNSFNPRLRLLSANGSQLAIDDDSAPDARNALLAFTPTYSGTYLIEVSSTTAASTVGEYVLTLDGVSPADPAFTVTSITPANNSIFGTAPATATIVLSKPLLLTSIQASDLCLDGVPCTTCTVAGDHTLTFTLPTGIAGGSHTLTINAGDLTDLPGAPLAAFSSTFTFDITPPTIIASSILENGLNAAGPLTITLTFSEPMAAANIDPSDFTLLNDFNHLNPKSYSYDASKTILTLAYDWVNPGNSTLTLLSSASAFTDAVGNLLDGERNAATTVPTGDGVAGGNFVLDFLVPSSFPTLSPVGASGTLVYTSLTHGILEANTDTCYFSLTADAGQRLSVAILPFATLRPALELRDSANNIVLSAAAATAGAYTFLQSMPVPATGTYYLTVSSVDFASAGPFALQAYLNAALETENFNGPTDDSFATAQNLDPAFLNLFPGSSAKVASVLGKGAPADFDWYSFSLNAGQSATLAAKRLPGSTANLSLNLFDAADQSLATSVSSATNFDTIIADFLSPTGGTYYACLTADQAADYVLTLTVNATLNTEPNDIYTAAQPILSAPSAGQFSVLGAIATGDATDDYAVALTAGIPITLRTYTPADGTGEFGNTFNPRLRLRSSSNAILATDDNSAPDARNALLTYTPASSDIYYVEVSSTTAKSTLGEYVLTLDGVSAPATTFTASAVSPANNTTVNIAPAAALINLSNALLQSSLQASDLLLDGIPCTSFIPIGDRSILFTLPTGMASGVHTLTINAGSLVDLRGCPLAAFSSSFTLDTTPPCIILSSILENDVKAAGPLSLTLIFTEPMLAANLDTSDFTLRGIGNNTNYYPTSYSYNLSNIILTLAYANLPEDNYTFTLLSSSTAFTDIAGNLLDGERNPATTTPTGDGLAGGNFILDFSTKNSFTEFASPPPGAVNANGNLSGDANAHVLPLSTPLATFKSSISASPILLLPPPTPFLPPIILLPKYSHPLLPIYSHAYLILPENKPLALIARQGGAN